jgi:hypothetical protein
MREAAEIETDENEETALQVPWTEWSLFLIECIFRSMKENTK